MAGDGVPYWRLYYHFVWATKGRDPLIQTSLEKRLHGAISAKAGALVHAVGGTDDHVHVGTSVPPSLALSHFVGQLKGSRSHLVRSELALPFRFL